ncbi:arsenite efflux transporter metallochaperone ArsD [Crenobacter caeni]|uniref:Arsenite efflux transporter metallochaperone ArsD n=1 Tax=Crenobacter caeni TaxID=2705474 RepID=A0A6B2KSM4_9NEIS|nr:arsenite efflux transporter metallochaperone ArsD [Crenobacter caeni]NDV13245.1 arsenite efflux transporter metallochaperone ArsD [Crenobacter caeni]
MTKIEIFDPALCCASGVCGSEVDQALVTFAADFDWAKTQGADIRRYNLAQEPLAFAENAVVKGFLERSGAEGLPLTLVGGEIALTGRYPRRAELARFAGISTFAAASAPVQSSCCGGDTGCC